MPQLLAAIDEAEPQTQSRPAIDAAEAQTEPTGESEALVATPLPHGNDCTQCSTAPEYGSSVLAFAAWKKRLVAAVQGANKQSATPSAGSRKTEASARQATGGAAAAAAASSKSNPLRAEIQAGEPRIQKDAPRSHAAHTKVKYHKQQQCYVVDVHNDTGRVRMQTTPSGADRSHEDAARIARLCYVEAEAGSCREDVLSLRDELYWQCRPKIDEDAPRNSAAHTKVKYHRHQQCFVVEVHNDTGRVRMQTTHSGADRSHEDAARIARLCYVEAEAGACRKDVLKLRDELYWQCRPKIHEDAPCTSAAHREVRFCDGVYKFSVKQADDIVDMQVSVKQANNIVEDAARIARLSYAKLEAGKTKEEVAQYRDGLSARCRKRLRDYPEGFDPSTTFLNRDLFGNSVVVPRKTEVKDALRPLADLEISDIDNLTSDDLYSYEREAGLSCKRTFEQRLARLLKLAQRNTISFNSSGAADNESSRAVSSSHTKLSQFMAFPEEEQRRISAAELKMFERVGLVDYAEEFTITERRDQLKLHIRKVRDQHVQQQDGVNSNCGRQLGLFETWARCRTAAIATESEEKQDQNLERLKLISKATDDVVWEASEKDKHLCTDSDTRVSACLKRRPSDADAAEHAAKKRAATRIFHES